VIRFKVDTSTADERAAIELRAHARALLTTWRAVLKPTPADRERIRSALAKLFDDIGDAEDVGVED
jgi:hypothetical protein